MSADEADLIEAQRLRDMARDIVRGDLDTLRQSLSDRPITTQVRDQAVSTAADVAQSGIDLALENRGVLALTLAGVIGWLFRKPLGALGHAGWTWTVRRFSGQRD